jgi:hypothetical protein
MKRPVFLMLIIMVVLSALAGTAQDRKKDPPLRTVRGEVMDKDEKNVANAIVHLKNLSTQSETTHITDEGGNYRFTGLDPNVDYEIHAEHQGKSSAKRTISTFDNRKEIILRLKLEK